MSIKPFDRPDTYYESPVLTFPEPRSFSLSIRATALVFEDPKSRELLDRLERIAPSSASALIIGETGTGKELIARHIHALSERGNRSFVAVNCASLSESLIETELFGHERGAFTGAVSEKAGWFETAHGGTLFLDEIGDLPPSIQVKLLRVLQEREVVRVGSRKSIPINVRMIAATNVDLKAAVQAGRFREDLYYRLSVAPIYLPPLRERPGDILPLAHHYLRIYAERIGQAEAHISPEAERRMQEYSWPGNIRELENVIHYALLVCPGATLRPEDLHFSAASTQQSAVAPAAQPESDELERALRNLFDKNPPSLYDLVEKTTISTAYNFCERNQVHTARLLNISRNVLRARLIRYQLL